jgi:hypothetical protein
MFCDGIFYWKIYLQGVTVDLGGVTRVIAVLNIQAAICLRSGKLNATKRRVRILKFFGLRRYHREGE